MSAPGLEVESGRPRDDTFPPISQGLQNKVFAFLVVPSDPFSTL